MFEINTFLAETISAGTGAAPAAPCGCAPQLGIEESASANMMATNLIGDLLILVAVALAELEFAGLNLVAGGRIELPT